VTARPDQVRRHTREVLLDVPRWSLAPTRWAAISAILDTLEAGLDLADPDHHLAALAEASVALELSAPERLTEVDKAATPAPDSVRERVNVLIHELTPSARQGADETSGAVE
jgi:hypothetical protein